MSDGWLPLGAAATLLAPGTSHRIVGKRSGKAVLLVRTSAGEYTCMDANCFHQGEDLSQGDLIDIESLGGGAADTHTVVRCPRHGRCVSVKTGEWVEAPPQGDGHAHDWCGHGHVQRMHEVRIDQTGRLEIRVTADGHRPSDTYNKPAESAAPGGGGGTIAWRSRKRAATEAVKQRATPSKPAAAAAAAATAHPTMRQPRIDALFSPRSSSPGAASSSAAAEPEPEAMDMDTE